MYLRKLICVLLAAMLLAAAVVMIPAAMAEIVDSEEKWILNDDGGVTLTNTRETGTLTISKTVTSPLDADKTTLEFTFTIKTDPSINGEFTATKGEETVTVKIPAGVAEGMQLSMSGKGNAGKHNGIPGDLLIVVEEEKDKELIRDENDLVYNLLLSVPTATLGGTVEIPTVDNKVKVKIEPGTQPGKVLRLRGKGLPDVNGYGTGDLLVNVSVYIPETLSRDEKKAMEQMQDSDNFRPSGSVKERIFKKFKSMFD